MTAPGQARPADGTLVTETVPLRDAAGRLRQLIDAPSAGKVLIRP